MPPKSELLLSVRRLGEVFARRGMPHVNVLRLYYLAVDHDLVNHANEMVVHWSEDQTLEWMRTLRIPPFHTVYKVRPLGSLCPRCRGAGKIGRSPIAELKFPGGARMRCPSCNAVWIEEDRRASR